MGFEIKNGILVKYTKEKYYNNIIIPENVKKIGFNAFSGCTNITSVIIPDSVIYIGHHAFWNCENLLSISIPHTIIEIGNDAFFDCFSLTSVIITGKNSKITINGVSGIWANFSIDYEKDIMAVIRFIRNESENEDKIVGILKNVEFKIAVAVYIIEKYNNQKAKKYIKNNIFNIAKFIIDNNDIELLTKILTLGYITKKNIDSMIKYAIDNKNPEIQVILSNYKNDNFGFNDNFDKFIL